MMARLALFLLGPPRIEYDGRPSTVDTRKATALLAYLAMTRRHHSRDALAALLWPDYDDSHARGALRRTLSVLHKALGEGSLDAGRETVGLVANAPLWLDVASFRERLAATRAHDHPTTEACPTCLTALAEAVALYQDDFLAGFGLRDSTTFEDWQYLQQEGLRRELAGALERLARTHGARAEYEPAITFARRWLALDRLHEPVHRLLMELYAWSGQHAAAVRQYRDCVRVLEQELGVSPLEETTRLYTALKERQAPPSPVPVVPPAPGIPPVLVTAYPLLGRASEWRRLESAYTAYTASAAGAVVALEGEAGIGKTRLAEEFLAALRLRGATIIATRCYPGETSLAYGPIIAALQSALARMPDAHWLERVPDHWLAEAARLLPELAQLRPGLPTPAPLGTPGVQSRFFEGLCRVLVALTGGAETSTHAILFIDDIHWADGASLDVLAYLIRRLSEHPLFLLLSWRSPDVPSDHRLRTLLAEAQRNERATLIQPSRLGPELIRELARAYLPGEAAPSEQLVTRLHAETEGVPFFLVEYLSAMAKGALAAESVEWSLPGGVRDLLRSRISMLGGIGRQVLTAAAVIGRSFEFETVREASGRGEEETVAALEELMTHGLVQEVREGADEDMPTYDFNHEKLRTLVYDETSLARRRLLHHRVAGALVAQARYARGDPHALVGQIAGHYLAAGDERAAADYYRQAGEQARALYANAEALAHLQMALALGYPEAAALHESIGELHTLLGEYSAALKSYETAAALHTPAAVAPVEHKIAGVYVRRGEWELAESHLSAAIAAWGEDGPPGELARAYADGALIARHRTQLNRARELAGRALELADAREDMRALAQAHNILGVLASDQGRQDEALHHLEGSLAYAERLNDPSARVAALNNLAFVHAARGDTDQARALTEAALAVCAAQGDRHHEAALHNNLADLLHAAGDRDAAMAHLKEAVRIYAEIGVEAGAVQPEIWKLSDW